MEENETTIEVLAPRCGMGAGLWVANLVALALGLGATGIGVLCLIQFLKGDGTFLFYAVFLLVLGAFVIVAETWTIFRALHSLSKGPSCLNYDEGKDEFEFFPIFGEPFKVRANCFGASSVISSPTSRLSALPKKTVGSVVTASVGPRFRQSRQAPRGNRRE